MKKILLPLLLVNSLALAIDNSAAIAKAQKLVTNEQAIIANQQSLILNTQKLYDSYSVKVNSCTVQTPLCVLFGSVTDLLYKSLITNQAKLLQYQALLEKYQKQLDALQTPVVATPVVLGPADANIITDKPVVPLATSVEYIKSYDHSLTGVDVAWAQGYTGKGVTVADLDTGVSNLNSDVNRVYNNPNNIIDFANIYNPITKTITRTQLSGGMLSEVVISSYGQTVGSTIPTVTISGNGSGATAVPIITNGVLTGVKLTNPGNGYSGNVTVTVTNPSTGAVITSGSVQVAGYDYYGHGTATSAIIAGAFNGTGVVGVAFDANIIDVKVVDSKNLIYTTDMIDGARAAFLKGATIMNQSIETYANLTTAYKDGYRELVKAGATFITAAGNQGNTCTTLATCNQFGAIPLQAGYSDMLTSAGGWLVVGALNNTGTDIASWSNRAGLTADFYILAPGSSVGVASNNGNTTVTGSGTSYAAPYVAGAMALLQQKWPRLSGNQQTQILLQTADDMGAPGIDPIYGHGKLDLAKAFSPAGDLLVPNLVKNVAGLNTKVAPSAWTTSVNGSTLVVLKLASLGSLESVVGFDSFSRDFTLNLTQNIKPTSNDFTFDSFLMVPISKHFSVGVSNEQQTFAVGYRDEDYTFKYSYKDGLMGSSGTGALGYSGHTHYFGMSYKGTDSSFTGLDISGTYSYGQAVNYSDSILNMSDIQAVSAKAEVLYNGFGLIGSVPNKVISGRATVTSAVSSDIDGNIQYGASSSNLSNGAFQKDVGLEYRNRFLTLQATKSYDLYGIAGLTSNDVKINGQWFW